MIFLELNEKLRILSGTAKYDVSCSFSCSNRNSSLFVPGGQSTQLIVGATKESDLNILTLSKNLYNKFDLKRVYYSAYVPVNKKKLPELKSPPTLREHRLYQSDWLLRVYGFKSI